MEYHDAVRRLGRYILNGFTVLSLLVFLATVVLWIRGNWYLDELTKGEDGSEWVIDLEGPNASFRFERQAGLQPSPFRWDYVTREVANGFDLQVGYKPDSDGLITDQSWHVPGFSFRSAHAHWNSTFRTHGLSISYWLIAILTLILPIARIRLRRKRHSFGRCTQCGYDLRATPQAGGELVSRCPECGTTRKGI